MNNLRKGLKEWFPKYLTTGAVAKYCGVSRVTVLRWIEKGNLTAFQLPGGQNRICQDDFAEFVKKYSIPIWRHMPKGTSK